MSRVNRPENVPFAVNVVVVFAAMVEEPAVISIEVNGVKSLFRVGAPSHPQPDKTISIHKPDNSRLVMHAPIEQIVLRANP